MYRQPLHHTDRMVRFRRWSRKKYAVLCSLHCHVTIGSVTLGIADRALSKTGCRVGCSNGYAGHIACDDDMGGYSPDDEAVRDSVADSLWRNVVAEYVSVFQVRALRSCVPGNAGTGCCLLIVCFFGRLLPYYIGGGQVSIFRKERFSLVRHLVLYRPDTSLLNNFMICSRIWN